MFGRGNKWSNGILGMEEECRKRKGKEGWDLLLGCFFVCSFGCELTNVNCKSSRVHDINFPCVDES
jgi:hypothetical protein